MTEQIDRRRLMRGLGLATLAGALLPAAVLTTAPQIIIEKTPQEIFQGKLEHLAAKLVGSHENGVAHAAWNACVAEAEANNIKAIFHYGTICGESTDHKRIVDALWWRVRPAPYRDIYDTRWWQETPAGEWVLKT